MIAFVDSSVILRLVLRQPNPLAAWPEVEQGIASRIVELECLRTLDRARLHERLPAERIVELHEDLRSLMRRLEIVELSPVMLDRAGHPFPVPVGSLDAIHLATALMWREQNDESLVFATHDYRLSLAARAFGFPVAGI